jgi:NitT/TauT family transport system substrate-binding protein
MMNRFRSKTVLALLALTLLAAPVAPGAAVAQTDVIRVGAGPVDTATPIIYAAKSGLYKKYGLNVEIVKLPNGATIAAALAGGSIELAQASSLAVVISVAKGLAFTSIGNLATYNAATPEYALLVLNDSAIKAPADLKGKTLAAVGLADMNSLATFAWLDARGIDRQSLKIIELPGSATLPAMEQGRVDASTFYEPFYTNAMSSGKVRVLGYPYSAIGTRFSESVIFGNTPWVDAHHDEVGKFLRATQEASTFIASHEAIGTQTISEFAGLDPAAIAHIHHSLRGVALHPADLQPMIDAAAKYKLIPQSFPAAQMICTCALH